MKIFLILLVLFVSCNPKKDEAVAPSKLKQQRMVMSYGGVTEVGIHGGIDENIPLKVRVVNSGDLGIRGQGDCGFYLGKGYGKTKQMIIDPKELPKKKVCVFGLDLRVNKLDAPSIGLFVFRRFTSPLVKPLKIKANSVTRMGVNWVQVKKDSQFQLPNKIPSDDGGTKSAGINEGRDIEIYPSGNSGYINISGCNKPRRTIDFTIEEGKEKVWRLSLESMYRGTVEKSCTFDILVNNRGYQYKEAATFVVHTYNEQGSFLDAPETYEKKKYRCFRFRDPYVVGISVNGYYTKVNEDVLCAFKKKTYEVIAITSNQRTFYGIFDEGQQDWTSMK